MLERRLRDTREIDPYLLKEEKHAKKITFCCTKVQQKVIIFT